MCGEALSRREMQTFLDACEGWKVDPVEFAFRRTPPGVVCRRCFMRGLADGVEREDPVAQEFLEKLRNLYRYGEAELPGGKPPVFH
jgi:hypothetical protein